MKRSDKKIITIVLAIVLLLQESMSPGLPLFWSSSLAVSCRERWKA